MRRLLMILVATAVFVPSAMLSAEMFTADGAQKADPSKYDDIVRLLEVSNDVILDQQLFERLLQVQKQTRPDVPETFCEAFRQEIDAEEIIRLIVGVYDRHFSHEEVRGLISFYESPLGARLVSTRPAVMRDSALVAREWAQRVAERLRQKLETEGYSA